MNWLRKNPRGDVPDGISITQPRETWLALYRKLYWENCYVSGEDDGVRIMALLDAVGSQIGVQPEELTGKRR